MEFKVSLNLTSDKLQATLTVDDVVITKDFSEVEDYHVVAQELLNELFSNSTIKAEQLTVLRKQLKVSEIITRDIRSTLWENVENVVPVHYG
jgi:hypothetical protein